MQDWDTVCYLYAFIFTKEIEKTEFSNAIQISIYR